ncbi:MAG: AAA family ATPase [Myxococcota bacterium]|jgi:DNA-binding winged helix-turn-helix (wHTH) protein|nr:AAA family ATPase [Myxococcota bacterium]
MRYVFGNFEFDTIRGSLLRGGLPIPARAKVIALLADLIQHRTRIVYKGELDRRLWPDVVVGSTSLSTLIGETRSLLGDSGCRQTLIHTEPGRGYRFVAPVQVLENRGTIAKSGLFDPSTLFQSNPGSLAALEETLAQLEHGCPKPLLLTGPPGSGKRQCVNEVLAISRGRGLAAYLGRSSNDEGNPNLAPWIEILRSLMEDIHESKLPPLIAPDLLNLAQCQPECIKRLASEKGAALSGLRFRLMDSLCRLFRQTALRTPFVLILENLHFADRDSLALYEKLLGCVGEAPIALMATTCPIGLLGEHPNFEALGRIHASRDLAHIALAPPRAPGSWSREPSNPSSHLHRSRTPDQASFDSAQLPGSRTPVPPMPQ